VINPKGGLGVVSYKFSENGPCEKEGRGRGMCKTTPHRVSIGVSIGGQGILGFKLDF
jgi:hypothetical protein